MAIRWTEDLAVGVERIDQQHRELFGTAARLIEGVDRGGGVGEAAKMVVFLEEYVLSHFALEELYMKRHYYPAFPSHKAEHTAFISHFYDLRDAMDRDGATPDLAVRLAEWLGGWLVEHIGRQDKALGAFLKRTQDPGTGS
jgi:hemerythrin